MYIEFSNIILMLTYLYASRNPKLMHVIVCSACYLSIQPIMQIKEDE